MRHVSSSSLTRDQTRAPLHWEHRVLDTGLSGKSSCTFFLSLFCLSLSPSPSSSPIFNLSFVPLKMLLYALPFIPYEYTDAFFGSSTEILNIMYPTKIHVVKATVFPIVKYGCESWTIKEAECQRIYAFELCWRRLLRVPWTARRSSLSFLKEIYPEYYFKELMLKLKLQ